MLGGKPITLFHVRGIRIEVDWSWFFVLFLFIVWQSQYYGDVLGESGSATAPFALAVLAALGFFGSIVLHELGHAMVALHNRIGIASIRLWIFGGMARMDRESDSPSTEFKVAIAGPLVTLAIVVALTVAGIAAGGAEEFKKAMLVESNSGVSGPLAMVAWLASINFLVLVFNLLPAFPMDGGRIVRAIAWQRTGDRTAATRLAASLGRAFGYLFIAAGLFMAFKVEETIPHRVSRSLEVQESTTLLPSSTGTAPLARFGFEELGLTHAVCITRGPWTGSSVERLAEAAAVLR